MGRIRRCQKVERVYTVEKRSSGPLRDRYIYSERYVKAKTDRRYEEFRKKRTNSMQNEELNEMKKEV